ncbi:putative amidohydrolase [Lyophyllum shimeji]|uniref:Amidohydrolase n=1 Tax=Lyophyllum shimeji TaxID=47721 RepID=A0A9P3PWZ2_LYOSH|nr:putative amidohydrolase [Lyophyllum shimeji]
MVFLLLAGWHLSVTVIEQISTSYREHSRCQQYREERRVENPYWPFAPVRSLSLQQVPSEAARVGSAPCAFHEELERFSGVRQSYRFFHLSAGVSVLSMTTRFWSVWAAIVALLGLLSATSARNWRNSGTGAIALEEAWTVPELVNLITATPPPGQPFDEFKASFLDVHGRRLDLMNQNNIDFMVLSCATPCIQGISDPATAAEMAVNVNNQLAAAISNNTARFGGFASLAMHDAIEAAQELRRAVNDLGFQGALLNDYQQSGPDNTTLLFYDQPEYDVFWQAVTELDVPIYFHPRPNIAQIETLMYAHAPFIEGPSEEYAVTLANHILGLCTNGVFDRFPTLKIIVGHLGERLPSDLFRIDEQLQRLKSKGLVMQRNVSSYWRTNLYETTSGNFATALLRFHIDEIGLDRIMYSVDYPFVPIPEGEAWVLSLSQVLSPKDLNSLKRGVAIKLLHLDDE